MKIFITGIEGVLGSTLKTKLRSQGHSVFGCGLRHSEDWRIVRADVGERRQLARALDQFDSLAAPGGIDLLYHFAAEFGRINGQNYYEQLWKSNCLGTRNVIEECVDRKIKMVMASSSEAYGLTESYADGVPLSEGMLDKTPPQFHNEYALTKYTNERQVTMAVRNKDLDAIILRFFNVYGPPERFSPYRSVVCQLIYKLLAGESVTVNRGGYRTHLWIGDWARTVSNIPNVLDVFEPYKVWPGAARTRGVPVFNIGGNEYESIAQLLERILKIFASWGIASTSKIQFVESEEANTATKQPDNEAAIKWLDHRCETGFESGLKATIQWTIKEYGF